MGGNVSSANFQPDYAPFRLASPFSELQHSYDVIVIGSGYGGSIAACRAARAGQKVCLLEKGKEWRPGDFPEKEFNAVKELQFTAHNDKTKGSPTNLFDLIISPDVAVLQGCGLGGTSLINANAGLDCEDRIFEDQAWPQVFRDDLEQLKDIDRSRVYSMLKPAEYPDFHLSQDKLPKLVAMEAAAQQIADIEDLNVEQILKKVPLYVNFKNTEENHVGIPQPACINCGNCCGGCNTGAKNTLNMNYLPDAKAHGAKMFTEVEVKYLSRDEKTGTWRVHYIYHGQTAFENRERVVRAKVVILGAGALGSTNVLLHSQRNGLKDLSPNVGKRFTTNGDTVGFSYNGENKVRPAGKEVHKVRKGRKGPGPCITQIIDMRHRVDKELVNSYVLEDGTPPCSVDIIYKFLLRWVEAKTDTTPGENDWRELGRHLTGKGWKNSLAFLAMSNDDAHGDLKFDEKNGRVWVDYPQVGEGENFQIVKEGMTHATTGLKGHFVANPFWGGLMAKIRDTKGIITVHPLGGCPMAESGKDGVVNHAGQAFKGETDEVLPGLYVMDGAVMPRCLGVNPTLTISMVAERCMRLMGEQLGWSIDNESKKKIDLMSHKLGIKFTERMVGKMSILNKSSEADFILTIETQDVEKMISKDPSHSATIHGTVSIPGLSSSHFTVSNGQFTLFSKNEGKFQRREMTYCMLLSNIEGDVYYFKGIKVVSKDSAFEIGLGDTTTLNVSLHKGEDETCDIIGTGRLHIKIRDFIKQLGTMEVTNASNAIQRLKWKVKFGNFFAGCLWEVYGIYGSSDSAFDPKAPPREKRALKINDLIPEVHQIAAADDTELLLTRYQGGNKGPVMLVHEAGMSSRKFVIDTVETNLVEYLISHGFDVWLADWRTSIKLQSHKNQSTLDDSAKYDIPALVDKVIEVTGSTDVQVIGHSAGSVVVFASLLSDHLEKGKIRSIIASQTAFQFTAQKSRIKVPFLLSGDGINAYTDKETSWTGKLKNQFFESVADVSTVFAEHCDSHVCHRITVMYGQLYEHENLGKDTHTNLHEQFGFCNVTVLKQLKKCIDRSYLVSTDDKSMYLPDFNKELKSEEYLKHMRRLNLPILFIGGDDNKVTDPKALDMSYERCKRANPGQVYQRQSCPGYGHMDSIIGKDAHLDVFPKLLSFLEIYAKEGSVSSVPQHITTVTDYDITEAYSYGNGEEKAQQTNGMNGETKSQQTNGSTHVGNGSTITKQNSDDTDNNDNYGWRRKDGMRSPRGSPRGSPHGTPTGSPLPDRRESLAPEDARKMSNTSFT